jgi:hypothetical protein
VATYRFGSGKAAPPAGAVTQIARPVIGLRSVRSPIAATEGRDPEGPTSCGRRRQNRRCCSTGRFSARDFEIVAGQQAGVVKVTARFAWIKALSDAGVVVRFIGTPQADALRDTLAKRAELNLIIDVHKAQAVPATLSLVLEIDPDFLPGPVMAEVKAALLDPKTGPLAPVNATIGVGAFLAGRSTRPCMPCRRRRDQEREPDPLTAGHGRLRAGRAGVHQRRGVLQLRPTNRRRDRTRPPQRRGDRDPDGRLLTWRRRTDTSGTTPRRSGR